VVREHAGRLAASLVPLIGDFSAADEATVTARRFFSCGRDGDPITARAIGVPTTLRGASVGRWW
jgi:hypothetical protein